MSDGDTGGAVPGAAEVAAIRERAERWGEVSLNGITVDALYCMAESARDDLPALLALVDTLTLALARALAAVPAPFAVFGNSTGVAQRVATTVVVGGEPVGWHCPLCGAEGAVRATLDHATSCAVRILEQVQGGRDGAGADGTGTRAG